MLTITALLQATPVLADSIQITTQPSGIISIGYYEAVNNRGSAVQRKSGHTQTSFTWMELLPSVSNPKYNEVIVMVTPFLTSLMMCAKLFPHYLPWLRKHSQNWKGLFGNPKCLVGIDFFHPK